MSIYHNLQATMHFHNQKHPESCVASAFEFVAKLHGLIPPESFPHQENPKNQTQSFADSNVLVVQGLKCQRHFYNIGEVLPTLEKEMSSEKVALIALLHIGINPHAYHVYCVIRSSNQLLLVDPAVPRVVVNKTKDLTKVIQRNHHIDRRKTFDILLCETVQDN